MAEIPESTVAAVVAEISQKMANPSFAQVAIGTFVERHPDAGRFVSLQAKELGGSESVVHVIFHAQVISECFRQHTGNEVPTLTFALLDAATRPDPLAALGKSEPALRDYLEANVDQAPVRTSVAHLALAMRGVPNLGGRPKKPVR
ncbi:MAG: hypothetical protein R3A78_03795 [Polyangiales bacterium]|nr:hypothetical protein [Myxococcales bacterium]